MNARRAKLLSLFCAVLALAGCGEPTLAIENPLAVINVAPHDGAVGIERSVKPTVCFSEQVDAARAGQQLFLVDAQGARVEGIVLEQASDECIALRSPEPLAATTSYAITIAKGLQSTSGRVFAADVTSRFTTGR